MLMFSIKYLAKTRIKFSLWNGWGIYQYKHCSGVSISISFIYKNAFVLDELSGLKGYIGYSIHLMLDDIVRLTLFTLTSFPLNQEGSHQYCQDSILKVECQLAALSQCRAESQKPVSSGPFTSWRFNEHREEQSGVQFSHGKYSSNCKDCTFLYGQVNICCSMNKLSRFHNIQPWHGQ